MNEPNSHQQRYLPQFQPPAVDNPYPIHQQPIPSVPTCPHCGPNYWIHLPTFQDFLLDHYQGSTRISELFLDASLCWQFRNYRGEIYYRSNTFPRSWYYQHPERCVMLCEKAALDLDKTYGRFPPPLSDPAYNWMYRGYVKHSLNGSCLVRFSPDVFSKQSVQQCPQRNTNEYKNTVSPPPGFPAAGQVRDVHAMDVDSPQQQQFPAQDIFTQTVHNKTPSGQASNSDHTLQAVCQNLVHDVQASLKINEPARPAAGVTLPGTHMAHAMGSGNQDCAAAHATGNEQLVTPMEEGEDCQQNHSQSGQKLESSSQACGVIHVHHLVPGTSKTTNSGKSTDLPPKAINHVGTVSATALKHDQVQENLTLNDSDLIGLCEKHKSFLKTGDDPHSGNVPSNNTAHNLELVASKETPFPAPPKPEDTSSSAVDKTQLNIYDVKFLPLTPDSSNNTAHNLELVTSKESLFPAPPKPQETSSNVLAKTELNISEEKFLPLTPESKTEVNKDKIVAPKSKTDEDKSSIQLENKELDFSQEEFLPLFPKANPESHSKGKLQASTNVEKEGNGTPNETAATNTITYAKICSGNSPGNKRSSQTAKNQAANVCRGPSQGQQSKVRNLLPADQFKIDKAFSSMQNNLIEKYKKLKDYLPTYAKDPDTLFSTVFDLIIKHQDEKTKNVVTSSSFMEKLCPSRRKILLQASPSFGKTTMCFALAHRWSAKPKNRKFKLFILGHLPALVSQKDLEQALLTSLNKSSDYRANYVREVVAQNSDKIFLVLDGYDALSEDSQKIVVSFLKSSVLFSDSYVLVATRPVSDSDFLQLFDIHAFIRGFSTDSLKTLLPKNHSKHFLSVFSKHQLSYLSELSPSFTYIVAEVAKGNLYKGKCSSLYDLVDRVLQVLISHNASADFPPNHVQLLGEKLFFALIWNKYTFTEDQLKRFFGDYYNVFLKCNIFYRQSLDRTKLTVSSKILMVFFATMYLRTIWTELLNDKERTNFLKDVFCSGCCDGDYVTPEDGSLYYVGLLPEVVLKFGKTRLLEDSTFEMYYDVDRVECSHAFDSVNLLSRIKQSHLRRFNFECKPDDCPCHSRTFDSIYKVMSFDSCSINCNFYSNPVEGTDFMKVEADGSTNNTLQAVLRARQNGKLDRMYVDFEFSELAEVFEFVNTLLCSYSSDVELSAELKTSSLPHFIETLVERIFSSSSSRSATVTCSNDGSDFNRRLYACFSISSNPETGKRCLLISYKNTMKDQNFLSFSKYRFCDLNEARIAVQSAISDCETFAPNLRITINFL